MGEQSEGTNVQGSDAKRKQSVMNSDDRERKKQKAISWGVVLIFSKNGKGGAWNRRIVDLKSKTKQEANEVIRGLVMVSGMEVKVGCEYLD